jgi:transcriptional regulator of acetoin/glycerol metabolism
MKILISWQAYRNDYSKISSESGYRRHDPSGPTFGLHRFFWESGGYDRHIILNSSEEQKDQKNFKQFLLDLREAFPNRQIEGHLLKIEDVINVSEITSKISGFLAQFSDDDLEAFISPGTPAMQTAWYLIGTNFKNRIRLFQTRAAKFTDGETPEQIYLDLDSSEIPVNVTVAQALLDKNQKIGEKEILITDSLQPIYERAKMVANTDDVGCLILGENGTGKENLANYIHSHSNRREKPFQAINCAAFSDELLRSELFGHKKGSFTGAVADKKGLFEVAKGGTIFLDEIGDISPQMQVSLLRVLQEKKVQPVGSTQEVPIDVRIVAATNQNLEELCERGKFRWDLFFRIAVTTLKLPALRERGSKELEEMISFFNRRIAENFPSKNLLKISIQAKKALKSYGFKGNVRELENLFIQFYTFCHEEIKIDDLPDRIKMNKGNPLSLEEVEKQHLIHVYGKGDKSMVDLANLLGCTRDTLRSKLRKYSIID